MTVAGARRRLRITSAAHALTVLLAVFALVWFPATIVIVLAGSAAVGSAVFACLTLPRLGAELAQALDAQRPARQDR